MAPNGVIDGPRLCINWLGTILFIVFLLKGISVLCNVQYSNLERAHRYYGTALKHLEGLRHLMRKSNWTVVRFRDEEFIGLFYWNLASSLLH
jgi:hypothetical protein